MPYSICGSIEWSNGLSWTFVRELNKTYSELTVIIYTILSCIYETTKGNLVENKMHRVLSAPVLPFWYNNIFVFVVLSGIMLMWSYKVEYVTLVDVLFCFAGGFSFSTFHIEEERGRRILCHPHRLSRWFGQLTFSFDDHSPLDNQFQCRATEVSHPCGFQWVTPQSRLDLFSSKRRLRCSSLSSPSEPDRARLLCPQPIKSTDAFPLQWRKYSRAVQKQDRGLFRSSRCLLFLFLCCYRNGVTLKLCFWRTLHPVVVLRAAGPYAGRLLARLTWIYVWVFRFPRGLPIF